MQQNNRKTVSYYLRALHRDVGFFVVGLIIIYTMSGIVLVYRDTDFLIRKVQVEKKLLPGIDPSELGKVLQSKACPLRRPKEMWSIFRAVPITRRPGWLCIPQGNCLSSCKNASGCTR